MVITLLFGSFHVLDMTMHDLLEAKLSSFNLDHGS